MKRFLQTIILIAATVIINAGVFAADLSLGTDTRAPGETAIIPVTITDDFDAVNMISFTIDAGTTLPAPIAVKGTDQPNIEAGHCFVDNMSSGVYRITAFVVNPPNIATGAGEVVCLQFDLTGIPEDTYLLTVVSSEIFNVSNVNVTNFSSNGCIIVDADSARSGWMLF